MEEDRYTRITLRIPRELHEKLQNKADLTSKSMNAEIVARLEKSFEEEKMKTTQMYTFTQDQIDEFAARVAERIKKKQE